MKPAGSEVDVVEDSAFAAYATPRRRPSRLQKVLVANRGEIARRFFFALREAGIASVAVVTDPDRDQSWADSADEVVLIGDGTNYSSIPAILAAARRCGANAIYPGYGFLSENPEFPAAIEAAPGLLFMGPSAAVMRRVGHKLDARALAQAHEVPVFAGSASFPPELSLHDCRQAVREAAARVGYPVILKLNAGGGGKGMEIVHDADALPDAIESIRRIGQSNYGDATFYLEQYITAPVHIEVQIFNGTAIGVRKCAVQRRNQKVIEESGESLLAPAQIRALFAAAERMARASGYASERAGAGTVEFLYDAARDAFGFLEMNTRLQVEYAVTDLSRNVDLVQWQIQNFDDPDFDVTRYVNSDHQWEQPPLAHAVQCRIYAEDAFRDYAPAPGRITGLEPPAFHGVRCDFGFQDGDEIVGRYDPMVGKLIAWGPDRAAALARLERALGELYIQGLTTNLDQLLRIVRHPVFRAGQYDNRLLDAYPELNDAGVGPDAGLRVEAAIFGCVMFTRELAAEIYSEFFAPDQDLDLRELAEDPRLSALPSRFRTTICGEQILIELIQVAGGSYYTFVDDRYTGVLHLEQLRSPSRPTDASGSSRVDPRTLRVRFGGRTYRLRTEHRAGVTQVRCTESGGRVNYYRMRIQAVNGGGPEPDPAGMVRAPFRGTFVALGHAAETNATQTRPLQPGDWVRAGQAVITLSAMKMETRVFAPCDGTLAYIIEEGRLERLILGQTPEGLIQGKNIAEGDVLFVVAPDSPIGVSPVDAQTPAAAVIAANPTATDAIDSSARSGSGERSRNLLDHLHRDSLLRIFDASARNHLRIILSLTRAALLGWLHDRSIIKNVLGVLESLDPDVFQGENLLRKETEKILRSFLYIRRAFSPAWPSSLVQFHEINRLLQHGDGQGDSTPYSVLTTFDHFGQESGYETPIAPAHRTAVLFEMLRTYRASNTQARLLLPLIARWSRSTPESAARPLLARLLKTVSQEARHRRNSRLEAGLRQALQQFQGRVSRFRETDPVFSRNHLPAYRTFVEEPLLLLTDYETTAAARQAQLRAALLAVAATPTVDDVTIPAGLPEGVARALQEKLEILLRNYHVALVSFDAGSLSAYRLIDRADPDNWGYVCFAWPHEGRMIAEVDPADGRILGAPNIENSVARAAALLTACGRELAAQQAERHIWYRLEVVACTNVSPLDLTARDPRVWNRQNIKDMAAKLMLFFTQLELRLLSIDIAALHPKTGDRRRMQLSFYIKHGEICVALLVPEDPRHPYFHDQPADSRNARLFARGKWPAEIWARESFDAGSAEEIRIDSIDGPDLGGEQGPVVGARLYRGTVSGRPAWYFLKDSRRNGGATGDLEGRKFVAAAYLAYVHNAPLYVWNDGAGANIKEGMVALNRAAQGFMMNALLAGAVSYGKFYRYTRTSADPALQALFTELDARFQVADFAERPGHPDNVFLVAIGVGSSTGLDVYGSSQASVQILLDSEQSYRVLTGSNVIRSVTGEDLTNYEIGGARVMGLETGTADIIALDRLDLLARIRHVHELFSTDNAPRSIIGEVARATGPVRSKAAESARPAAGALSFNEDLLCAMSDQGDWLPLKKEYYGSGSLLGGFLRFGGHSTLVLGPRTEYGTVTEAAATRARELFRVAQKTGSHTVLVTGAVWHRMVPGDAAGSYRRYQEFVRDLGPDRRRGLVVLICTEPRAILERFELTAQADVTILVDSGASATGGVREQRVGAENQAETARNLATFCTPTLADAFMLARELIAAIGENTRALDGRVNAGTVSQSITDEHVPAPVLPDNASAPFDVYERVIAPVFDSGSFLEFFSQRDPTGQVKSLCTGLARLDGRVMAIIADQPVDGGAPDAPGTEKFRVFMEFVARFQLPLVMLSNAPGFVPGTKQERLRIQQIGGESLDVNVLSENPVVSVVLNQNFGGRQIHAFSKFLRPGIAYVALDRSTLAVMGARAAFDLFHGRRYNELIAAGETDAAHELRRTELAAFEYKSRADQDAARTGLIDIQLRDLAELRQAIVSGLELARTRLA